MEKAASICCSGTSIPKDDCEEMREECEMNYSNGENALTAQSARASLCGGANEARKTLARPAGQSEREAKRKALRAPRGGRVRLRPYRPEGARSRLISDLTHHCHWESSP